MCWTSQYLQQQKMFSQVRSRKEAMKGVKADDFQREEGERYSCLCPSTLAALLNAVTKDLECASQGRKDLLQHIILVQHEREGMTAGT